MSRRLRIALGVAATVIVASVAVIGAGRLMFERRVAQEIELLYAAAVGGEAPVVTGRELAALPEAVQRWLRWAGVEGTRRPVTVYLTQTGRFRLGTDQPWMPFAAEEHYTTDPPGFVWPATFEMAPLLRIGGRDAYVDGQGSIDMRLLWLIPVASQRGPELDQGALLRYLNEIVWFPAAALSPAITWEEIDAASAQATISHAGVTATATFFFDDEGRPVDMRAERYRTAGDGFELTTWSTPFREYGEFAGIRVPVAGEGIWKLETGDFSYVDLRVISIAYGEGGSA